LDRLAGTDSMSLRRFLMDRLVGFGELAGPALIGRLVDERWYFLRNLIVMIRQLKLTRAADRLRVLAGHRDPRVSLDALKTLLEFGDPEAEGRLVRDLESQNRETQLAALKIAGNSGASPVLASLHEMLAKPGLSAKRYEMKSLAVPALGEIANPASLAVLEPLLASHSILHPILLTKLKLEIVTTLGRYPVAPVRPLLTRLSSKNGEVGRQAAQMLRSRAGRTS
jgi:HEAT repeat protein